MQRAFLIKYKPEEWAGFDRTGDDEWPLPGMTEPLVHDKPPRKGDLLVWQDSPRRRLMGHGVATGTKLLWHEGGHYGEVGENGEQHWHGTSYWFAVRVDRWLPKRDAARMNHRDREWTAYPYRHVDGLSSQCSVVPIPLGMARRFIRAIDLAR
jgi:hypothetical protein